MKFYIKDFFNKYDQIRIEYWNKGNMGTRWLIYQP